MKNAIFTIVVTAVIVGGGTYYWLTSQQAEENKIPPTQPAVIEAKETSSQPAPSVTDLETYSSDKYTFKYPSGYTITLPNESFPALTIKRADNKKMEIFQIKDFPGNDRPFGFTGEETQEEVDGYVSKEDLTVGTADSTYDVWLYYSENDSQTQKELKAIFDTIAVK